MAARRMGRSGNDPHPDLDVLDVTAMVEYIMGLDAEEEARQDDPGTPKPGEPEICQCRIEGLNRRRLIPGLQLLQVEPEPGAAWRTSISTPQPSMKALFSQVYIETASFRDWKFRHAISRATSPYPKTTTTFSACAVTMAPACSSTGRK